MHQEGGDKIEFVVDRVEKNLPLKPEDVEPELSDVAARYVEIFLEINGWRQTGGMGPSRITLPDVHYYCQYTGVMLNYLGLRIIRLLDDCYLAEYFKANKK